MLYNVILIILLLYNYYENKCSIVIVVLYNNPGENKNSIKG